MLIKNWSLSLFFAQSLKIYLYLSLITYERYYFNTDSFCNFRSSKYWCLFYWIPNRSLSWEFGYFFRFFIAFGTYYISPDLRYFAHFFWSWWYENSWILNPWCIFWVLRDAMARSESWLYHIFSALLVTVLSPIVGLPLYLAFRPLVYKWERGYWREAMTRGVVVCPRCRSLVDEQHKACVFCGENLKTACKECETQFYRGYGYCPECWAPNISE